MQNFHRTWITTENSLVNVLLLRIAVDAVLLGQWLLRVPKIETLWAWKQADMLKIATSLYRIYTQFIINRCSGNIWYTLKSLIATVLFLTHWGRVTHTCVSKLTIGSDNGLPPGRRQAIIWTNAGILLVGITRNKLRWNFNRSPCIFIHKNPFENVVWKWWPFCLGLNVLTLQGSPNLVIITIIVRRAGLLWSQQDFEWRWSVPLFKCLTVLEFSFILFDLCLLITFFNFIMNYVPFVTFWIFTYHKIWILSIMSCFIWSYWIIYFLACLEVSWRVVS